MPGNSFQINHLFALPREFFQDVGFARAGFSAQNHELPGLCKSRQHVVTVGFITTLQRAGADTGRIKQPGKRSAPHTTPPAVYEHLCSGRIQLAHLLHKAGQLRPYQLQPKQDRRIFSCLFVLCPDFGTLIIIK